MMFGTVLTLMHVGFFHANKQLITYTESHGLVLLGYPAAVRR